MTSKETKYLESTRQTLRSEEDRLLIELDKAMQKFDENVSRIITQAKQQIGLANLECIKLRDHIAKIRGSRG